VREANLREFLEKISEGWKPCNLDYLEKLRTELMGLFQKLRREVEKKEREKVCIFGENDILPF
jgi:phage tail tape-measure protein